MKLRLAPRGAGSRRDVDATASSRRPAPQRGRLRRARRRLPRLAAAAPSRQPPFEGPLDLLLAPGQGAPGRHPRHPHRPDHRDYLATLELLRELDIDLAGELPRHGGPAHAHEEQLLLPRTEVAEDAEPPRSTGRPARRAGAPAARVPEVQGGGRGAGRSPTSSTGRLHAAGPGRAAGRSRRAEGLADVSVFKLIEALDRALRTPGPRPARDRPRSAHHHRRHRPGGGGAAAAQPGQLRGAAARSAGVPQPLRP